MSTPAWRPRLLLAVFACLTVVHCTVVTAAPKTALRPHLVLQTGHGEDVSFIAVSPDERTLASVANDSRTPDNEWSQVILWDARTQQQRRALAVQKVLLKALRFRPTAVSWPAAAATALRSGIVRLAAYYFRWRSIHSSERM